MHLFHCQLQVPLENGGTHSDRSDLIMQEAPYSIAVGDRGVLGPLGNNLNAAVCLIQQDDVVSVGPNLHKMPRLTAKSCDFPVVQSATGG